MGLQAAGAAIAVLEWMHPRHALMDGRGNEQLIFKGAFLGHRLDRNGQERR
jgi:hypothetical protein